MIGLTIIQKNKELDIYISPKITLARLKELIQELFKSHQIFLPNDFQLIVKNKIIHIGESDVLSDLGIANGDKLEIISGEKYVTN